MIPKVFAANIFMENLSVFGLVLLESFIKTQGAYAWYFVFCLATQFISLAVLVAFFNFKSKYE